MQTGTYTDSFHLRPSDLVSSTNPGLQKDLTPFPSPNNCIISGPKECGKTSILFHLAHRLAAHDRRVLFITSKSALEEGQLLLPEGISHIDNLWSMISLKYVESTSDILRLLSLLHLAEPLPDAILIDNLQTYCFHSSTTDHHRGMSSDAPHQHKSKDALFCKILAVLKDSADYIGQKKGRTCFIAASFTTTSGGRDTGGGGGNSSSSSGDGRILHICQRWLPIMCDIKGKVTIPSV
jgi:hypothetical protein